MTGGSDGRRSPDGREPGRGQLSLTVVEAAVGALLVVAVVGGFALGGDVGDGRRGLADDARDAAVILRTDTVPNGTLAGTNATAVGHVSRADALTGGPAAVDRVRESTRRRLRAALPAGVLFRVETRHGSLGLPRPTGRPAATAPVAAANGTVQVWVWYA